MIEYNPAIHKYFSASAQSIHEALQILVDPENDEDLFSIHDRWFQTLLSARADSMEMLALVGKEK